MRDLSATAAREVPENTEAGENIGAPVTANDPDNDTLTYTLEDADLDSFDIDSASGQIQTMPGVTYDHETKSSYSVTVKADYNNGGTAAIDLTITITVTDVDEPPEFSVETASRTIAENTTTGVAIGAPVTASDPDTADTPACTLGGTDANFFDIDTSSGQLRTKAALDYEVKNTYQISVSVRDGKNAEGNPDAADDATITVTITVTNVEEPGKVTLNLLQPQVGTGLTTIVTDPDGGVRGMTWEWESSSDNKNTWTPISGAVSGTYFPVDADVGNYLRVTVSYTDAEGWQLFII